MMRRLVFTLILIAGAVGIPSLASGQTGAEEKKPDAKASQPAPSEAKPSGDYVGSDVCVTCHEAQQKSFIHTAMGNAFSHPKGGEAALGCESCHGPGKAHVDAGGGKDSIPVRFSADSHNTIEEKNAACLSCHNKGNQMFWLGSPHESRAMACVDCHNAHYGSAAERYALLSKESRYGAPLTANVSTKKPQPELCLSCHQMRRAQLQRSSHMPYREGKVTCTSCHNPHGSPNPSQLLQASVNENCYSCHAERRGNPWAPSRISTGAAPTATQ